LAAESPPPSGDSKLILVYNNDLDRLSIFASMPTSLLHFQLKRSRFLSLLI
jgi:hypothetical protein